MDLAKYYYNAITEIANELNLEQKDILPTLIRMPEIVSSVNNTLDEVQWNIIAAKVLETCEILNNHRHQEGVMLTKHIENNIQNFCNFQKHMSEQIQPLSPDALTQMMTKHQAAQNFMSHYAQQSSQILVQMQEQMAKAMGLKK